MAPYSSSSQVNHLLKLCSEIDASNAAGTCMTIGAFDDRIPGQLFFTVDLNNKSIDPNTSCTPGRLNEENHWFQ